MPIVGKTNMTPATSCPSRNMPSAEPTRMRKPCRKDTARSYPVCEAVKTKKSSEGPSLLRPFSLGAKNKKSLEERMLIEKAQRKWVDDMEIAYIKSLKEPSVRMSSILEEMGVRYNPVRLANALKGRQLEVSARAFRITYTLGRYIIGLAKDYSLGQLESNAASRAAELRDLLSQLGPSFVKVGQALSSRPDLLPQVYLETLSSLQDRLPPFPNPVAMTVIEQELKQPVNRLFSYLSPQPVAAASLGQVYKGQLRSTGEEVAVKVQRPDISENIAIDMLLLRRFMKLVDARLPTLIDIPIQPLVPLVDEFAGRLFSELDYVQEGKNAERFQELYGSIPRVRVPKIIWGGLTSRRVLTMEWIDGVKLTDSFAMAQNGLKIVDFVDVGIECSLRQLLAENGGFFHADPHPGNLLATTSGDLAYLDFGMMSEAPQYARYAIISHVTHLVNRDYEAMCRDYYTLQFMDPSVDTRPIAPALAAFFDNVLDKSISELNFKAIVDGLGGVLFKYPFRVPAYYALILRSLTVLEGLALTADKSYKLLAKAYPYMAKRLLTDSSPELRESFRELVLDDSGRLRWNRVENLIEESSKTLDQDPAQLWLIASWVLGDTGSSIRGPFVDEIARLMDAAVAGEVHEQVERQFGPRLADRLVPFQPTDDLNAKRARVLYRAVFKDLADDGLPKGTGPFGTFRRQDVRRLISSFEKSMGRSWPEIQGLLRLPGALAARQALSNNLAERAGARFIKLVFGPSPRKGAARQPSQQLSQQRVLPPVDSQSQILSSPAGPLRR